jgi:hypothetical protein
MGDGGATPLNYIEFLLNVNAYFVANVDYLVFEFFTRDEDGDLLYASSLLPGIRSGDEFPCQMDKGTGGFYRAASKRIVCTYYAGSSTGLLGNAHRIFVSNF